MKKLLFFLLPLFLAGGAFYYFSTFVLGPSVGKGALQVTSLPVAKVYLDGKEIGKTPLCKCEGQSMLAVGDYMLRIVPLASGDGTSSASFDAFEEKITIGKSVLTAVDRTFGNGVLSYGYSVTLTPLEQKNKAQVFVTSFPDHAKVLLDNSEVGTTPLLLSDVVNSEHDLSLVKPGYGTREVKINVSLGYKLTAVVWLPVDGKLPISLTPSPILSPSATPSASITPSGTPPAGKKAVILETPTGFLRVRKEPSLTADEISRVEPGKTFPIVSEETDWTQISLDNGQKGWVSNSFIQKQE